MIKKNENIEYQYQEQERRHQYKSCNYLKDNRNGYKIFMDNKFDYFDEKARLLDRNNLSKLTKENID